MKKVEMILEKRFLNELIAKLDDVNIQGYSLVEIARGSGAKSGKTVDYGFTCVNKNFIVMCVCSNDEFKLIKSEILPFLKEVEGYVYVAEVEVL